MAWKRFAGLAAALTMAAGARAEPALTAADQAHIATIETSLSASVVTEGQPRHTLAGRMAEMHVPAVSVAYFEHGHILWAKAWGLADVASGRPATPATLFQAASISKTLTAVAAMSLVQEGKLRLDDDVNLRLKAWKVPDSPFTAMEKVTLRRILSHTAGLTVHGFNGYERDQPTPSLTQVVQGVAPANSKPVVVEATPGARWSYSGGGYVIAQLMMTEATGKAFPDLMRDRVLRPAGMTSSTFVQPLPTAMWPNAASGYTPSGDPVPGGWRVHPEESAAGLWTTPSDLARFAIAFQNAKSGASTRLLTKASADEMTQLIKGGYGIGFALSPYPKVPYVQHGGSNAGFQSQLYAFTDGSGRGVAIMTNGDMGFALISEVVRAVAVAYDWPTLQPRVDKPAP